MDDQNKNLILATALSFLVILIWFVLFPPPEQPVTDPALPAASATSEAVIGDVASTPTAGAQGTASVARNN